MGVLSTKSLKQLCMYFNRMSFFAEKQSPSLEAARGFHVLLSMSSNPECLGYLLRGLLAHIPRVLRLLQQQNDAQLHRNMAALLHNTLKVSTKQKLHWCA